jgi:hypothetical protein
MMQLAEPVIAIAGPLLEIATSILPVMFKILLPIAGIFQGMVKYGGKMESFFKYSVRWLSSIGKYIEMFGGIGKFFIPFAKILGPLGLIITAFSFIGSLMKSWQNGPKGLLGGLLAVYDAVYDTLIGPFVKAWDWISTWWHGHSPSKLGLGILEGIVSVSGMILDAITLPFRSAFNFVSGLFGGVQIPVPSQMIGNSSAQGTTTSTNSSKSVDTTNILVVQKLQELIDLMKSGAIGVNIDGNRANYLLSQNITNRGGLGAI